MVMLCTAIEPKPTVMYQKMMVRGRQVDVSRLKRLSIISVGDSDAGVPANDTGENRALVGTAVHGDGNGRVEVRG